LVVGPEVWIVLWMQEFLRVRLDQDKAQYNQGCVLVLKELVPNAHISNYTNELNDHMSYDYLPYLRLLVVHPTVQKELVKIIYLRELNIQYYFLNELLILLVVSMARLCHYTMLALSVP
jgi:hypothetical protein